MIEIKDRSPDHRFTMNYAQPSEYHFCLDSILFPKLVADLTQKTLPQKAKVMDLGAGCGVLGYEFLFYRPDVQTMTFVERQKIFEFYLLENKQRLQNTLNVQTEFEFKIEDLRGFKEIKFEDQYDLILVNPPYYFEDEGVIPPEETKAHCHFFLSSNPKDFLKTIQMLLKPSGEAYILVKKPERWNNFAKLIQVGTIRGTAVMKLANDTPSFESAFSP